jgi:hypothetical protein
MASHLEKLCSGLRSSVYAMQWKGPMMICCGMAVKMEMLGGSVRKMMAFTVKMESVTLTDKGS